MSLIPAERYGRTVIIVRTEVADLKFRSGSLENLGYYSFLSSLFLLWGFVTLEVRKGEL